MQITLNLELTPENLDKLKIFCEDTQALAVAPAAPVPAPKKTATKKTAKAEAPSESPEPETPAESAAEAPKLEAPETPAPTKTDVRAVALKLSKAGKSAVLKEIFAKFGAEKLSDIKEDQYTELMKELNAVG